jgi:hypothetical protein
MNCFTMQHQGKSWYCNIDRMSVSFTGEIRSPPPLETMISDHGDNPNPQCKTLSKGLEHIFRPGKVYHPPLYGKTSLIYIKSLTRMNVGQDSG